jgi:hypothetical protein
MTKRDTSTQVQTDPGLGTAATDPGPDPDAHATDPGPTSPGAVDEVYDAFNAAYAGKSLAAAPNRRVKVASSTALSVEERAALAYQGQHVPKRGYDTPPPEESILVNVTPVGPPPAPSTSQLALVDETHEPPPQSAPLGNTAQMSLNTDRSARPTFRHLLVQVVGEEPSRASETVDLPRPAGFPVGKLVLGALAGLALVFLAAFLLRRPADDSAVRPTPTTGAPTVTSVQAQLPPPPAPTNVATITPPPTATTTITPPAPPAPTTPPRATAPTPSTPSTATARPAAPAPTAPTPVPPKPPTSKGDIPSSAFGNE